MSLAESFGEHVRLAGEIEGVIEKKSPTTNTSLTSRPHLRSIH
jgi:hypothetical protein